MFIISFITLNYVDVYEYIIEDEIVAVSLEPVLITALCFFPENNSEKEKLNLTGQCGFILFDLSLTAILINFFEDFYATFSILVFLDIYSGKKSSILIWIIAVLMFLLGICLAPMLLANKKFDNDKI